MNNKEFDVVVVGGGVVGLSSAFLLAKSGHSVCVVERGRFGREASWAGGGILSPIHPHHYPLPLAQLCERSLTVYPEMVRDLESTSGMSVEHRPTGLLRLENAAHEAEFSSDNQAFLQFQRERNRDFEILGRTQLDELEPHLNSSFQAAIYESSIYQIRNPRLLKALYLACRKLGVECRENLACRGFIEQGQQTLGIETDNGAIHARETLVTAGPWTDRLLQSHCPSLETKPVHGMMILLDARELQLDKIMIYKGFYLIPRSDGQLLVGSTLERRGFDKRLKVASVLELLQRAVELIPALKDCYWEQVWSGLRPSSPDRLPFIGRPDDRKGLIVASGHYRNGLLLAPATAELVAGIVAETVDHKELEAFRPNRLAKSCEVSEE